MSAARSFFVAALALTLAACGDDGGIDDATDATTNGTTSAATTTSPATASLESSADDTATSDATTATTTGGTTIPEGPDAIWALVVDGSNEAQGRLALAPDGNVHHLQSGIHRVSPDGVELGSFSATGAVELAVAPNGDIVVLAGGSMRPASVAAYDLDGVELWRRTFGDPVDLEGAHVAVSATGTIGITGDVRGEIDFGAGPLPPIAELDGFVALLDPAGEPIWTRRFADTPNFYRSSRAVFDPGGDLVFTGCSDVALDFGGGELPAAECFIVRVTSTGEHVASTSIGPDQRARGLEAAGGGGFLALVAPTPPGGEVVHVLGADGALLASHYADRIPYAIAPTDDGGFILGGSTEGSPFAVRSAYLTRHDAANAIVWDSVFGEPSQAGDHVTDIVTLPDGDLIVAGLFNNEFDLGSVMLTTDDEASFIARFPSSP
jgi:hypothetical protein